MPYENDKRRVEGGTIAAEKGTLVAIHQVKAGARTMWCLYAACTCLSSTEERKEICVHNAIDSRSTHKSED
jgi:hypothetical protein